MKGGQGCRSGRTATKAGSHPRPEVTATNHTLRKR